MNPEAEGKATAARFRREHRLGTQPLGDLVTLIEQTTGIDVAVLDAGSDDHGLTMHDPDRDAIFIGVTRTRNQMRQRGALAHELGHALFDDWSRRTAGAEKRAVAFARHLLLPTESRDSPVDPATRLECLELSTATLAVRFGWSDCHRALQNNSDHRRAPRRLLARALRGYREGVPPAQAIATLRGITATDAEAEPHEAGIAPTEHPVPWGSPCDLPEVIVDRAELDEDRIR